MDKPVNASRRSLLKNVAMAVSLAPLAVHRARAAEMPLISEQDPAALAVQYVDDASHAKNAQNGALCSNCSIYSGAAGAAQGPCTLFPGNFVKAAGWCNKWSGL